MASIIKASQSIRDILISQWVPLAITLILIYTTSRCIYNFYFHPLSKYPGPRLSAVSNVWYAYHWMTGKYFIAISKALQDYGDVVRIAPNELVFITPQAALDIYASQTKGLEQFLKADFISLGMPDQGLTWERDPIWHQRKLKNVLPAFSPKALRAKEALTHRYVDFFVESMKDLAANKEAIELTKWADWLLLDLASDLAYSNKLHQMEERKTSAYLKSLWDANYFVMMHAISKKFPLVGWLQYFFVPPKALVSYIGVMQRNKRAFLDRVEKRGSTDHIDHFTQMLSSDSPEPSKKVIQGLEMSSQHLVIAGWEPVSVVFLCSVAYCLQNPVYYKWLVSEIRDSFENYNDLTADSLATLPILHATIMETLRITVIAPTGLPRVSPGAMVDGHMIPREAGVQYGTYAFTRSQRYFQDAYKFHPQRWLPHGHPHWDEKFTDDAVDSFSPWSFGVRGCPGKGSSLQQAKTIIAKVLWTFDLEMLPGQSVDYEKDFRIFGILEKPEFWVRFLQVDRS